MKKMIDDFVNDHFSNQMMKFVLAITSKY